VDFMESIAITLSRFIHKLSYSDLKDNVKEVAKTRILDTLSSSFAGRDLPHSRTALQVVKDSKGNSTIFAHELKVSLLDAILVNAVLAHSILQEDMIIGGVHPSTVVVPAALAMAEQEESSGPDLLTAIVLGYELAGRMGKATGQFAVQTFRRGTILTTFGAAAAAGKLLKLSETKLAHTIGYAASLTPGTPAEGWWGGTMEPMFEAGISAQIGVLAALLAQSGATTAPRVLEGTHGFFNCWAGTTENAGAAIENLDKGFLIEETTVKPFPACGLNQMPIQTALSLAKYKLKAEDIDRIVERVGPPISAGSNFIGPFSSQLQAQMSMQFCTAATILGKPMSSFTFYAECYSDAEVSELAKKVELVCEKDRSKPKFEVYLQDGKVYVAEEEMPNQAPHFPTRENMGVKFRGLASGFLGKEKTEQIIDLIMNLDQVDNIRKLTANLGKS
jgi:2-methylcitrate dehydratase PrpD